MVEGGQNAGVDIWDEVMIGSRQISDGLGKTRSGAAAPLTASWNDETCKKL